MMHDELERIIGPEATKKLEDFCGGELVYVPKRDGREKAAAIVREWKRGVLRPGEIAKLVGCSERHVYRCISPN